jgi:hypothetical protein
VQRHHGAGGDDPAHHARPVVIAVRRREVLDRRPEDLDRVDRARVDDLGVCHGFTMRRGGALRKPADEGSSGELLLESGDVETGVARVPRRDGCGAASTG